MSKFVKPEEWKCEACCVRNHPPSAAKCLSCETPKSGGASAWSTGKSAIGGRAGNPSAPAPGAFLFSAPSASGLNQNPGAPLFQSPGPATGGFIFGAGGESVGNSAGFGGPSARSNFGRPPVPRPSIIGTRRGCSGPPLRSPRSPSEPPKTPLSPASGPLLGPPREEEAITRLSPPSLRGSCLGRVPRLLERTLRRLIRLSLPSLRVSCLGSVPRLLERTLYRLPRKITPLVRRPSSF